MHEKNLFNFYVESYMILQAQRLNVHLLSYEFFYSGTPERLKCRSAGAGSGG